MVTSPPPFLPRASHFLIALICMFVFGSCAVIVRDYPRNTPFVYKTNINIKGNISSDTVALLVPRLKGQLDDSMRARSVSKVLWSVMKKPPVYKSDNAEKSVTYMKALLRSMGYTRDSISYDTVVTRNGDQYKTTVNFNVNPGIVILIDSFAYNFKNAELQRIALENQDDALVKEGDPFAKATISSEFDRLVELYRTKGFLKFGREEMIGLWDTLNLAILNPSMDPFEQILLLDSIKRSRNEPKANLEIRLRPNYDSSKMVKFYVGNIYVYPEFHPDTTGYTKKESLLKGGIKVIYYEKLYRPKIFPENIYFRKGDVYNQKLYLKTINRFNTLGSWRLVNIEPVPRKFQDTADYIIKLTPAKKYSFTANIEGSRNQSAVSGNLFGIALNLGLQNRNFARGANLASTNLRYGIEAGDSSLRQTEQFAFSHNISFPRLMPPFKFIPDRFRETGRTILAFNAANTERAALFNLTTVNASWGYELQAPPTLFFLRFPNIEYSYLVPRQKLLDLFASNPSLKNIFTDGLIASIIGGFTLTDHRKDDWEQVFRMNSELSGLITGLVKSKFLDTNLYQFIKADAEIIRKYNFRRNALVTRIFLGIGWEFEHTANPSKRNNLPFFKEYFAGGPNSMRAWGLRKLGPGSALKAFKGTGSTPERYGDLQIETNLEYRFPLTSMGALKVNGAVFTDIGNIWFLKNAAGDPEEVFSLSRFFKDLGVGIGTGLRLDFGFFVVRMDYSYKAKDPSPSKINPDHSAYQNKWFAYPLLKGDQFQIGLSYPFIL